MTVTFVARVIGFAAVLALAQYVYTAAIPPRAPRQLRLLGEYLRTDTEIIYFGDSTIHHFSEQDRDRRAISQILEDSLDGLKVGKVAAAAYNAEVFEAYVDYLLRNDGDPDVVILPINVRTFSPEWDQRPEYQFEGEKLYARLCCRTAALMFYRPGRILGDMRPISPVEYRSTAVHVGAEQVGVVRDFDGPRFRHVSPENMRKKLVLRYMGDVDRNHRKLRALKRVVHRLRRADIDPVLYLTPVDQETGEKFLGPAFRRQLATNVAVIQNVAAQAGASVMDLSSALPARAFNWGRYPADHLYPNEHMKELGRQYVAERLKQEIAKRMRLGETNSRNSSTQRAASLPRTGPSSGSRSSGPVDEAKECSE